jgi:hypothetical protein
MRDRPAGRAPAPTVVSTPASTPLVPSPHPAGARPMEDPVRDTEELPWAQAATVHQAEGALAARFGLDIDEATRLLRTYAEDAGTGVEDVALDVLAPLLPEASGPGRERRDPDAR